MILNDKQIENLCNCVKFMIQPFNSNQISRVDGSPCISFGLGYFGYDIRVGRKFKLFTPSRYDVRPIDPKNFKQEICEDVVCKPKQPFVMPPHSFALAASMERIQMPSDCIAICMGKSTYARCGLIVNITPLEPGWQGEITIEISNTTPRPALVYPEEGIAQLLFFQGGEPGRNYQTTGGKYQGQRGITLPRMKE